YDRHPLQAIDNLRVHGLLDPQGAILIEGSDALRLRNKRRARPVSCGLHEIEDGLLCHPLFPGWQRVIRRQSKLIERPGEQGRNRTLEYIPAAKIHDCLSVLVDESRAPPGRGSENQIAWRGDVCSMLCQEKR